MNTDLEAFRAQLEQEKLTPGTVAAYLGYVRGFLKFTGDRPVTQLGEDEVRPFFERYKTKQAKYQSTCVINRYIKFTAARLPVVMNSGGRDAPRLPTVKNRREMALRQSWEVERQLEEREAEEMLIAKLVRQLVNHYLFFKRRIKGGPEDVDELYRFTAECEQLIQDNLQLFMELSEKGLNVHSLINQRAQR